MSLPFIVNWLLAWLPWNTVQQHNIGAQYATGDCVRQNNVCAARWYRRAARNGDAESQYDLGFMYLLGDGVQHNSNTGVYWLERSVKQGNQQAIKLLADILRDGTYGVETDLKRSDELYKLADKNKG